MTVATVASQPPTSPAMHLQPENREPEVLTRRSPSVKSSTEPRRTSAKSPSIHRHNSTHSQTSDPKRRSQESLVSRRQSERRKVLRIQNYVIYRKTIGAGSMGKVKLAECLTEDDRQQYAVKIMPKVNLAALADNGNKAKDPKDTPKEREQRTVREMAMMKLLRHPNICQLKEWVNEGDYYYMFLEYVDGGQLLDYIISHGKLREKQARKFARQILSALDYCHRNSIVHRDLKIENILITRDEDVKIIDFGLSNIYSPSRLLSTFCGSLYFAAPELLQARHYTGPEVDVWSFGVVLYVLVCGRVPFDDTSLPALHSKIKAGQVDGYPEHLSKDCIDLLTKILVVDPAKRYTLSQVRAHPWMNKGYDEPIQNHIPHRQPLDAVDLDIVEGMGGFGFGTPDEISDKLRGIITQTAYRQAASQIDQNYQQQLLNQGHSSRPRWRRSIRGNGKRNSQVMDDPQNLPAMYDPLVSIYYLAKEKKEYDQRQRHLKRGQAAAQSVPSLRRSNSTITTRSGFQSSLTRRKTDRAPSTPKLSQEDSGISRSGSVHFPTARSSTLLARSKSAAKRLGAMLPNTNIQRQSLEDKQQQQQQQQPQPQQNNNGKELPQLPIEEPISTSMSTPLKKTFQQLLRVDSTSGKDKDHAPRSSWRRLSINRSSSKYTRASMEAASANEPMPPAAGGLAAAAAASKSSHSPPGRVSMDGDDLQQQQQSQRAEPMPMLGVQPKSLFNFNRRHLFRISPNQLMDHLTDVFSTMHIRADASVAEPYVMLCECDYPNWTQFLPADADMADVTDESLRFTVLIYQARWAGGRLGVKVREAEDEEASATPHAKVYRNLYHAILSELGKR